jgi:hypothetical protein
VDTHLADFCIGFLAVRSSTELIAAAFREPVGDGPVFLDHDDFGSDRFNMNVIDSNILRSGMRAENRSHFSSSRARRELKPVLGSSPRTGFAQKRYS